MRKLEQFFMNLGLVFTATGLLGCGDPAGVGRTVPVSGRITLDEEPLAAKSTAILFKPDRNRGNTIAFEPAGTVNEQGEYSLRTAGKTGAPPGWYRVIVTAYEQPPVHPGTTTRQKRPVVVSLVHSRYGQEETTPLTVEVTDNPPAGAYDLRLTR